MSKNTLSMSIALALGTSVLTTSAFAANTYFDARNDAMGGVGVASSHYGVAALVNPALVAKDDKITDDFSLVLPSIGIQASDKDDLIDAFDDLSDSYDRFEQDIDNAGVSGAQQSAKAVADDLRAIDNKQVDANVGVNIVATLPTRWGSASLFANGYGSVAISTHVHEGDLGKLEDIANGNNPGLTNEELKELKSEARAVAALVQDYGLAVAKIVDIQGVPVHFGVTPKLQKVDTFNYNVNATNFETDDINDSKYRDSDTGFNADLGVAVDFSHVTFGLSARNLIARDIKTKEVDGQAYTYKVSPLVSAGAAYRGRLITLAADVDLTETKGFTHVQSSQYAGAGLELNAWDWAQLRAGYRADIKGDLPNVFTAGIGLSPFNVVHLDLAGFVGSDDALGAAVTMSYTF
ncbi:MAG: conjugal transfer protein TraF [Oceanisphaera sp.]